MHFFVTPQCLLFQLQLLASQGHFPMRAVPALVVRAELNLCQTHHLLLRVRVDPVLSPNVALVH
jgi:hypothetical protein